MLSVCVYYRYGNSRPRGSGCGSELPKKDICPQGRTFGRGDAFDIWGLQFETSLWQNGGHEEVGSNPGAVYLIEKYIQFESTNVLNHVSLRLYLDNEYCKKPVPKELWKKQISEQINLLLTVCLANLAWSNLPLRWMNSGLYRKDITAVKNVTT